MCRHYMSTNSRQVSYHKLPKLNNKGEQIDIEDILNGSLQIKFRGLRRYGENIEKINMKKINRSTTLGFSTCRNPLYKLV